jgi:hypothetical protein
MIPAQRTDASAPVPEAGTTRSSRALRSAVRLFPDSWRDRYGVEFEALLAETPPTPGAFFDVLVAAVDARLHPTGPRRRWPLAIERLRMHELIVFVAWVVFVVAGLGFQRMTEGRPFTTIVDDQPIVGLAMDAIVAGAFVSLLAVVVAGVPIALAIATSAIRAREWRQLGLLAVPAVALVVSVGITFLLLSIGAPEPTDPWRVLAFVAWVGTFVVAAAVSTVAVGAAALHGDVDGRLYRRAAAPALATAGAMTVVTIAVLVWGLGLLVAAPEVFWGFEGILATSTALTWALVLAAMTAATLVAGRAALRARAMAR